MSSTEKKAIVLFGHGARDPQWAEPMKRLQTILLEQLSGVQVELAFLELMSPAFPMWSIAWQWVVCSIFRWYPYFSAGVGI